MKHFDLLQEDIHLLKNIKLGDEAAFNVFFRKHYVSLCTYGKQFVSLDDAEGIAQEVMVWLWQNKEKIDIDSAPMAYLYKSIKNKCLTQITHEKANRRLEENIRKHLENRYEIIDGIDMENLTYELEKVLKSLPATYREAFELNRFSHLTYKEIAIRLSISPKTVDYRIQQALKILRKNLKRFYFLLLFF